MTVIDAIAAVFGLPKRWTRPMDHRPRLTRMMTVIKAIVAVSNGTTAPRPQPVPHRPLTSENSTACPDSGVSGRYLKVIPANVPEAPLVLDEVLGNATDLVIVEHATDTHGATMANFALFNLVGLQLSPRIRDLGKITLYRTGPRAGFTARYPSAGHLLTRRLNEDLITGMWDDLLRAAASVKGGHATAALVVGKLCSSRRQQNALASAIKEYGALRRTIYAARYLADETYRRRIGRQLNKGENLHALKRSLAYAGAGALRRRHHEQQAEQMWCLTLATNAVVTWTTEYHGLAVAALRRAGRDIDNTVLAHIWPTHHENVHFYGTHAVDVDGELAKLDSDGYRPLRAATATVAHDRRFRDGPAQRGVVLV